MNFSQYLRTLDEGNYGHDKEKNRLPNKEKSPASDLLTKTFFQGKKPEFAPSIQPKNEENTDSSGVRGESLQDWNAPLHEENEERPYNYGRDEDDEGYKPSRADKARAKKRREGMAASGIDENVVKALKQAWKGDRNPNNTDDAVVAGTLGGAGPVLAATGNPNLAAGVGLGVGGAALGRNITQTVRGANKRIARAKAMKAAKAPEEDPEEESVNDSLEIPMRDALGRLSIYSIAEGVAHMKRQLASKNITAAEKRKIQQKLHDKETRDRPRQLKRAGDPKTPLDIAVNAGDIGSEPVTPAPQEQRVSTPDETAKNKKYAPKWVKKMSKEERLARAANDAAEGERRENAEGMNRQSHLDEVREENWAPLYGSKEEIASRGETNEMTPEEVAKLRARRLTPQQRKEADDVHSGRVKEFPPNDPVFAKRAQDFARAKRKGRAHGTSSGPPSGGVNSTH